LPDQATVTLKPLVALADNSSMSFDSLINLKIPEADGAFCSVKEVKLFSLFNEKDIAERRHILLHTEYRNAFLITKYRKDSKSRVKSIIPIELMQFIDHVVFGKIRYRF
jgi:hypothetical protein